MAQSREPAGDVKLVEDATNNGELFKLALDLEDVDWLHEQDKERIVSFVTRATKRIKLARQPCGIFKKLLHRDQCWVAPLTLPTKEKP